MKPMFRGSLLSLTRYWWEYKTSAQGKVVAASIILTTSVAMVSLEVPAYQLVIALSLFMAAAFVVGWSVRPALEVRWRLPETAIAGQSFQVGCTLTNRSRFWARAIGAGAFILPPPLKRASANSITRRPGPREDRGHRIRTHPATPWRVWMPYVARLYALSVRVVSNGRTGHACQQ